MANPSWGLRYAPHIGFLGRPLFGDLVGDDDPLAQIAFIADQGFAGIQDPMAAGRSAAEQTRIGEAAAARGLEVGCFVLPRTESGAPLAWGDPEAGEATLANVQTGLEIARRLGSRHLAVLSALQPRKLKWRQLATMAEALKPAADLAAAQGVKLVLEATDVQRLSGMLLTRISDAAQVVRMAGHPAVRMVFDTAHQQAMDGNLLGNLNAVLDLVELVQIADHPGRGQPGSGEINFETFLGELYRLNFRGLCELEHVWSSPGREAEAEGLARLRILDEAARRRSARIEA